MSQLNPSEIIAIIPMRKGSKGCPNKNIAIIDGKQLYLYSVSFANRMGFNAIVSTDYDKSIIIPYIGDNIYLGRGPELSDDYTLIEDVLIDIFNKIDNQIFKYCLLLQPTAPLRSSNIFNTLKRTFIEKDKKGLSLTVKEQRNVVWKSGTIQNGKLLNITNNNKLFFKNRQSLPKLFSPDGCMYLFSIMEFMELGAFPTDIITPTENDASLSIDIDTFDDLEFLRNQMPYIYGIDGFEWLSN